MAGRANLKIKSKRSMKSASDKSSSKDSEEEDMSVLHRPFKTNITNLTKLIKLYQTTTEEIKRYLAYENDILHECRVCRSIFRSVSNFILHKQSYCQEQYSYIHKKSQQEENDECVNIIEKETNDENKIACVTDKSKTLNSVLTRIAHKKLSEIEIQSNLINEINSINGDIEKIEQNIVLSRIEGSNVVFQTVTKEEKYDEMKQEVSELHKMLNGGSAVLGPDGKVFDVNQKTLSYLKSVAENEANVDLQTDEITCDDCNIKFSTRKTYLSHMKYKHNDERMVYPCPDCVDTFANPWSVYRHLMNVHRKTVLQVRKLRTQIQARACRKDQMPEKRGSELTRLVRDRTVSDDNQAWIDNFECDNDIQMCGGCGRRFERRAALNSHSQTCQKRIALRNTITSNKLKRSAIPEEKPEKKTMKLDLCTENKAVDKRKPVVTKRKKAGIQIRYDYTKVPQQAKKEVRAVLTAVKLDEKVKEKKIERTTEEVFHTEMPQEDDDEKMSSVYPAGVFADTEALYTIIGISRTPSDVHKEKASSPVQDPKPLYPEEIIFYPSNEVVAQKPNEEDPLCIKSIINENSSSSTSDAEIITNDTPPPNDDDPNTMINENTLKIIQIMSNNDESSSIDNRMAHHVDMKSFTCIPCNEKQANLSKLRCHMARHFNWMRYRCDICNYKSYDKVEVRNHVAGFHDVRQWTKIDAVVMEIPEWEVNEMATKNCGMLDVNTVVMVSDDDGGKETASKARGRPKKLKKVSNKAQSNDGAEIDRKDPSDTEADRKTVSRCESSASDGNNIQDPIVRKMVYEVIFGENSNTNADICIYKENNESTTLTTNVANVQTSRPVRNRKNHLDKDFVYDLQELKELTKTAAENVIKKKIVPAPNNEGSVYYIASPDVSDIDELAVPNINMNFDSYSHSEESSESGSDSDVYIVETEGTDVIGS